MRGERRGNIGPALIDIRASKSEGHYLGVNLSTQEDWVFRSPMSWHPGGTKGMWIEGRRGDRLVRMQVVRLPDYQPAARVAVKPIPRTIPYSTSDLSAVMRYAKTNQTINVKVYGRRSGYIEYRRTPEGVTRKTYVNFSDDGQSIYSGSESMEANPRGRSTYRAQLRLSGARSGIMDLAITFGPLGGRLPAQIIFAPDASGTPLTHGYAEFEGMRLSVDTLLP